MANPPLEMQVRLVLWRRDLVALLGVSQRTLSRMMSNGDMPAPDVDIRGRRGWKAQTVTAWQAAGCPRAT